MFLKTKTEGKVGITDLCKRHWQDVNSHLLTHCPFSLSFSPLFLGENDFCICLQESFPQLKTKRLTRVEWCKIRRLMGKPRRWLLMLFRLSEYNYSSVNIFCRVGCALGSHTCSLFPPLHPYATSVVSLKKETPAWTKQLHRKFYSRVPNFFQTRVWNSGENCLKSSDFESV